MAQGRGSASQVKLTVALLLCLLLVFLENIDAATYTVGDSNGWTFNMVNWPKGKRFRAGDVLGKYISSNIVKENEENLFFHKLNLYYMMLQCSITMRLSTMWQQ